MKKKDVILVAVLAAVTAVLLYLGYVDYQKQQNIEMKLVSDVNAPTHSVNR